MLSVLARFGLVLLLLVQVSCSRENTSKLPASAAPAPGRQVSPADRIRAVTLDAVHPPDTATFKRLRMLGVTHVALIPFGFQPAPQEPVIRMKTGSRWHSESDDGIRTLARRAAGLGMQVIIKPHIWIGDYSSEGQARHRIGFDREADWQKWEKQYRQFILHYARLAQDIEAPLLVVGTELSRVAHTRPAFWQDLIAEVRTVYDGKLTYAANWYQSYKQIPFWEALDYIGVQAYFPLSEKDDPAPEVLRQGWKAHAGELARLSKKVNRPVLFTELGYRSVSYAAAEPWRWPSRKEQDAVPSDEVLQARLYRTFFEHVWPRPWMAGAILWKWHAHSRRARPLGFTPQGKQAEEVIGQGFNGHL